MKQIKVSEKKENGNNLAYIKSTLGEVLVQSGCEVALIDNDRAELIINCPDCYSDIINAEITDKISEIIAINYKYEFFNRTINVSGLNETENEILYASLISADLSDDKKYCTTKITNNGELAIDGLFNFRMTPLKRKWEDIASYMPSVFINSQLKEFIVYLLENKKRRAYIDNGRVYDSNYRRLIRCNLLPGGKARVIREVLMSNCGEIELAGRVPEEDEYYLKEFYGDKIYFSGNFSGKKC